MKIITIKKSAIDRLANTWPSNNLNENVDLIVTCFDYNGDLIDYDAVDENDNVLDIGDTDGAFMLALFSDAQQHAKPYPFIPGTIDGGFYYE